MTLAFTDVPTVGAATDIPLELDASPSDELRCTVCGDTIVWAGRGRKPMFCTEHRQKRSASSGQSTTAKNENLAKQAAATLIQVNGFVEMMLRFSQMTMTADELSKRKVAFQEQLYQALLTDPDLCRSIMSGGGVSAKLALILAYGMLGSAVIPVGVVEYRERRALAGLDDGEV